MSNETNQISMLDLQNVRHLIGSNCSMEKKLNYYATLAQCPELKQMLTSDATYCKQTKDDLISLLK